MCFFGSRNGLYQAGSAVLPYATSCSTMLGGRNSPHLVSDPTCYIFLRPPLPGFCRSSIWVCVKAGDPPKNGGFPKSAASKVLGSKVHKVHKQGSFLAPSFPQPRAGFSFTPAQNRVVWNSKKPEFIPQRLALASGNTGTKTRGLPLALEISEPPPVPDEPRLAINDPVL